MSPLSIYRSATLQTLMPEETTPVYGSVLNSALFLAASVGDLERVRYLLTLNPDLSARTEKKQTALHVAVQNGHLCIVNLLLEKDLPIDAVDSENRTPLYYAIAQGHTEITEALLYEGATLNNVSSKDLSPMHLAAFYGHVQIISLLHTVYDFDINAPLYNGLTPLHIAARENQSLALSRLIELKASMNVQTEEGSTPLHLAMQKQNFKCVSHLLERGACSTLPDKKGRLLVHIAAENNDVAAFKMLRAFSHLKHFNAHNHEGYGPLHIAATLGHEEATEYLIKIGVDINACSSNKKKKTALHIAVENKHHEIVSLLLSHNADANKLTADNLTAYDIAHKTGHKSILPLFESYKADAEPVSILLSLSGNPRIMNPLTPKAITPLLGTPSLSPKLLSYFPETRFPPYPACPPSNNRGALSKRMTPIAKASLTAPVARRIAHGSTPYVAVPDEYVLPKPLSGTKRLAETASKVEGIQPPPLDKKARTNKDDTDLYGNQSGARGGAGTTP